ncbi:4'-phosphopantetheinyl transferase superfamily protein [Brevibacillus formosus]|uniref:4'-phosphopantetheinyl transferase n=1 Tax=Brevibacillus formosus TaxID=54913 RepID=A0A837KRS2_9BACL|nr:4'-phosphopantetheinyl transferase superfamily protein [Brevibacillus formosus]KLI00371.1 hypothetical protein AA984_00180 [Brevibacillus formosus]MED1958668.1 4'-phosphopantetheinyl transferase superfamily protein [Brevibacillus formosus]PSJ99182.1 phosphopantetheine-protein transferase [Brevibacillus formosus]GED57741.1 4'-phosphopantetheinyl transferase [Brevibacillus formosus]
MQIYAVPISTLPDAYISHLLTFVTEEKKQRLSKFLHREDLIRGLLGDLLIRKIVSEKFAIPPKTILFSKNTFGKPYLYMPLNLLHFNISHSGKWIVCIIDEHPVGIDIERIHTVDLQIAKQFFAQEEYEFIENEQDALQRHSRFFKVWTAKESYVKAIGHGFSIPLNSFSTVRGGGVEGLRVYDHCNWYFKIFFLDDQYTLTACAQNDKFCETVEIIALNTFVQFFLND